MAATTLAGCGGDAGSAERATSQGPRVVGAFYPFAYVAERVAGDAADVENLTAPGVEAHDLELTPQQVARLAEADVVVYERGFQPAVDDAVEQNAPGAVVDVTEVVPLEDTGAPAAGKHAEEGEEGEHAEEGEEGEEHAGEEGAPDRTGDPHIWLDPSRLAEVAQAVAVALAEAAPEHAGTFQDNAADLVADLETLDREMADGLADCQRRVFVTSHSAFGYLAQRYDLEMVGISGLSPDAEPSPARVAEVQQVVRDEGVSTIFYERLVSPKVAETMADDLGIRTAVLDPVEGLTEQTAGQDYLSLMRANLAALREANGCA